MKKAFTLIELLIVVAIIAILAAIAVPNFLEAQTRSKVSRVKADQRTLDTGLMTYYIDSNAFPKGNNFSLAGRRSDELTNPTRLVLERLTTPVAYLTNSFLEDPFKARFRTGTINSADGSFALNDPSRAYNPANDPNSFLARFYSYTTPGTNGLQDVEIASEKASFYFVIASASPIGHIYNLGGLFTPAASPADVTTREAAVIRNMYDATNGTISVGGIFRVNGTTTGINNYGGVFFDVATRTQSK